MHYFFRDDLARCALALIEDTRHHSRRVTARENIYLRILLNVTIHYFALRLTRLTSTTLPSIFLIFSCFRRVIFMVEYLRTMVAHRQGIKPLFACRLLSQIANDIRIFNYLRCRDEKSITRRCIIYRSLTSAQ